MKICALIGLNGLRANMPNSFQTHRPSLNGFDNTMLIELNHNFITGRLGSSGDNRGSGLDIFVPINLAAIGRFFNHERSAQEGYDFAFGSFADLDLLTGAHIDFSAEFPRSAAGQDEQGQYDNKNCSFHFESPLGQG
jgi:hypothetical protein